MHILITGVKGQMGSRLAAALSPEHTVTGIDLPELDLSEPSAADRLAALRPELVIHCAAWTDVDGCARDPDRALRANAYGTRHVALACRRVGAPLLALSTNEVFDGRQARPYLEYDPPNPINPYGYSKWVGEQIVRELLPEHYLVRISWLIARGGSNFIHRILARAREGAPLRVVTNEIACPTYAEDLVPALIRLALTGHYGTYHLTNAGSVSRWGLARFALDAAGHADVPVEPITLAQYPRPSTVPERAVLANHAAAHLGIVLRPWQDAVRAFLAEEGLLA